MLALVFASILNSSRLIGRWIYSLIVLLPYITAVAIVALVFRMLLTTNGGFLNVILNTVFRIEPVGWLDTTQLSKLSIAIMNLWRMTGYFALVMLAGLQKIPRAVNEAAMLDGASVLQKFFKITVPLMLPEIFFVALISTIWIFQNVGDVMLLTGGGPINSSTTLIYYIYQNAYEYSKMGYASALSNILFIILLGISIFVVMNYYRRAKS
jgi:ABC-type sugar transport system permease subunit